MECRYEEEEDRFVEDEAMRADTVAVGYCDAWLDVEGNGRIQASS